MCRPPPCGSSRSRLPVASTSGTSSRSATLQVPTRSPRRCRARRRGTPGPKRWRRCASAVAQPQAQTAQCPGTPWQRCGNSSARSDFLHAERPSNSDCDRALGEGQTVSQVGTSVRRILADSGRVEGLPASSHELRQQTPIQVTILRDNRAVRLTTQIEELPVVVVHCDDFGLLKQSEPGTRGASSLVRVRCSWRLGISRVHRRDVRVVIVRLAVDCSVTSGW